MPKLVKNGEFAEDPWTVVRDDKIAINTEQYSVLSLHHFLTIVKTISPDYNKLGVFLTSGDDPAQLKPYLEQLNVIAVDFPVFTDGRCFSIARQLRDTLEYKGELRAIGQFIQDQAFYLKRCGVDAFIVADDANIESIQASLNDFTEKYQAAADDHQPLFRRRA